MTYLKERADRLAQLRADIRAGFEAIERGEYEEYDERATKKLAEDIKRRGRQRPVAAEKNAGAQ